MTAPPAKKKSLFYRIFITVCHTGNKSDRRLTSDVSFVKMTHLKCFPICTSQCWVHIQSQKTTRTPCRPFLYQHTHTHKRNSLLLRGREWRTVDSKVEDVQSPCVLACLYRVHPTHNPNESPGLQKQPLCYMLHRVLILADNCECARGNTRILTNLHEQQS